MITLKCSNGQAVLHGLNIAAQLVADRPLNICIQAAVF